MHFKGSNDSVFGNSCQKGGEMSPKQKDRTTTTKFKNLVLSKSIYHLVSYCVQEGFDISFLKYYFLPLLNIIRYQFEFDQLKISNFKIRWWCGPFALGSYFLPLWHESPKTESLEPSKCCLPFGHKKMR